MKNKIFKLSLFILALGLFPKATPVRADDIATNEKPIAVQDIQYQDLQKKGEEACNVPQLLLVNDPKTCGAAYGDCVQAFKSCIIQNCPSQVQGFYNDTHYYCFAPQLDFCGTEAKGQTSLEISDACVPLGKKKNEWPSDGIGHPNGSIPVALNPHLIVPIPAGDPSVPQPSNPPTDGGDPHPSAPSNPNFAPQAEDSPAVGQGGGCSMIAGPVSGSSLGSLLLPLTMLIPVFARVRSKKKS